MTDTTSEQSPPSATSTPADKKPEETSSGAPSAAGEAATEATAETTPPATESPSEQKGDKESESATAATTESGTSPSGPVVSASKKTRPPYKFDPSKITLRFLFANNDGLTVTIECNPSDTIGEVKGALLSVWPETLPHCSGGANLRLVCMGKGYLMPDTRTLQECDIPVFKTHPTPVNVSVRPEANSDDDPKQKKKDSNSAASGRGGRANSGAGAAADGSPDAAQVDQGCACVLL